MKNRLLIVGAALASLIGSAPTAHAEDTAQPTPAPVAPSQGAQPQFGGEHLGRIREEIHLHEQRAHELEPIIARDRQARRDVEVDWVILERHARELHMRANDFRAYAGEAMSPRAQADMNMFATELDQFAAHDEENARGQHEIAQRLDHAIDIGNNTRDWHLKLAQRLRDWLAYNGF
jgi:hypothetical protein